MMLLLREALKLELPSFVLSQSSVAGDPVLLVSADATPAAGEEVAYIKILQSPEVGFPIPSLASTSDGRSHLIQLVLEKSAGLATVSVWTTLDLSRLVARLKDTNIEIQLYLRANGAIPVEGDIVAGNYVGSIRADVRHPNAGN
jgi:hypothetical protein